MAYQLGEIHDNCVLKFYVLKINVSIHNLIMSIEIQKGYSGNEFHPLCCVLAYINNMPLQTHCITFDRKQVCGNTQHHRK